MLAVRDPGCTNNGSAASKAQYFTEGALLEAARNLRLLGNCWHALVMLSGLRASHGTNRMSLVFN